MDKFDLTKLSYLIGKLSGIARIKDNSQLKELAEKMEKEIDKLYEK